MADADRIRDGLRTAARKRADGAALAAEGTDELRVLLRKAKDADGLTLTEAAQLAQVSRVSAWKIATDAAG